MVQEILNENVDITVQRDKQIIKTSVVGILTNVMLSAFKAVIGIISGSIAITLDAVNNISDASSGVITIVGTKLASRKPDRKHPFGYGRIEYLTAIIISVIVLYAGITSLIESIDGIIHPETPNYGAVSLIIVAAGVAVKIILGRYVKSVGKKVDSDSLVNSGQDALLDSIISASTLAAAGIYIGFGLSLEAYLGAIISAVIIKSGIDMLREAVSRLLGERISADTAKAIKETITSFPDVRGAYDLVLTDYGPNYYQGSVHIEVPDTYNADKIDELIRNISTTVYQKHHVILTAVGVYSYNTKDENAMKVRDDITNIVFLNKYVQQMHGFYINEQKKEIRFDIVISFDAKDRDSVYKDIVNSVSEKYPDYKLSVAVDTDFTES